MGQGVFSHYSNPLPPEGGEWCGSIQVFIPVQETHTGKLLLNMKDLSPELAMFPA